MKSKFSIVLALFFPFSILIAQVKLPSVFHSDMVLQQKSSIKLWGSSEGSSPVTISASWDNSSYSVDPDENGNWSLLLEAPEAGGPYELRFKDEVEEVVLQNVLVGEVWLCSGQSNMSMTLSGMKDQPILNSEALIANASNNNLRVFQVKRALSNTPATELVGEWKKVTPENAAAFSAVAYQFGQKIQEELEVPVGIIVSSWGGTPIKSWMSSDTYEKLGHKDSLTPPHKQPTVLYNAMIAPLTSFPVAGFLWYQGESDRGIADFYTNAMPAMVNQWRQDWDLGPLPFYYVQIAPWSYPGDEELQSPHLREAQAKAAEIIPNSAMVVTTDVGSPKTIHPADKTTVASRLASAALANNYGKNTQYKSPQYERFETKEGKVHIYFKDAEGLHLTDAETANFELAGADHLFHPATAKITNGHLQLESPQVKEPIAARYGFKNYFIGNLFNAAGLPASPFRTDNW